MSDETIVKKGKARRTVAIVGLGYVGLPLALLFIKKGFHVLGLDMDRHKLAKLNNGTSYISEIQDKDIQHAIDSQRFIPTNQYISIQEAEAVIICVPTPLTSYHTPDLSYLTLAASDISRIIRKGQLIILESSTYPGTTREVLLPILEKSGLKAGIDFHLGYSPERIDPGNKQYPVDKIPKVISGITEECLRRIEELYGKVFAEVHSVSCTEAAEMTKLLENSYRLVNISFVNELAMVCDAMNLNLWEIIDAAKTKPFGFSAFHPGPGIGGHCIPVDPSYLLWKMKHYGVDSRFIQISNAINHQMPHYIADQIKLHLSPKSLENANILIYGAAYKRDIADYRESASLELIQVLQGKRANVFYHDPYIPSIKVAGHIMKSIELTAEMLQSMDCAVLVTDHTGMPLDLILEYTPLVYDTRNVTKGTQGKATIVRLGGGPID